MSRTTSTHEAVGDAIRAARTHAGLRNQKGLADKLGVTQQTVSRWENGDAVTVDDVVSIEDGCNLPRGWIFRRAGLVDESVEAILGSDPALRTDEDRRAVTSFYRFTRDEYRP